MTLVDISRSLYPGTAVWPGDTPYRLSEVLAIRSGDSVNLTRIDMSAHTGTHIDAPLHFTDQGPPVDQLDLSVYWGRAQVVSVERKAGALLVEDFSGYDLSIAPRLLVRTLSSYLDQSIFPEEFVYPSPEVAHWLGEKGIILYGTDGPSVDAQNSKTLEGHKAMYRKGIHILEWLDLSQAGDGLYELSALPLKIAAGDGSPVRAVLRHLSNDSP